MTRVLKEPLREPSRARIESSNSNPFVQIGFVHFLQEASVSVRMRRTDSEQLSEREKDNVQKNVFSFTVGVAT